MNVKKNRLEWSVFAISAALVLVTLGVLVGEAVNTDKKPADIVVAYGPQQKGTQTFRLPISAENRGEKTAENVLVQVSLMKANRELEMAELTFPFLPKGSKRHGWVAFHTDPSTADSIMARATGYEEP